MNYQIDVPMNFVYILQLNVIGSTDGVLSRRIARMILTGPGKKEALPAREQDRPQIIH